MDLHELKKKDSIMLTEPKQIHNLSRHRNHRHQSLQTPSRFLMRARGKEDADDGAGAVGTE